MNTLRNSYYNFTLTVFNCDNGICSLGGITLADRFLQTAVRSTKLVQLCATFAESRPTTFVFSFLTYSLTILPVENLLDSHRVALIAPSVR